VEEKSAIFAHFNLCDFDLEAGHAAHCRGASLTYRYLHNKLCSNQKKNCLWTDGRTLRLALLGRLTGVDQIYYERHTGNRN